MKNISRIFFALLIAVMLSSISACDNDVENSKNILLSTGAKVGKEAAQGSIAELSKVIQLDQKSAKAYAGRGTVKLAMGNNPGAIADFTKAIELDPKSAGSYTGRGTAKFSSGDLPGSVGDFMNAAKVMLIALVINTDEKSAQ